MKKLTILLSALAVMACAQPVPQAFEVIPLPAQVSLADGTFKVKGMAVKCDENMDEASVAAVQRFVKAVETATGSKVKALCMPAKPSSRCCPPPSTATRQ